MALKQFINDCHTNLVENRPDVPLNYLKSRGLTEESILTHKIGYCEDRYMIPEDVMFFGCESEEEKRRGGYGYVIERRIVLPIYSEFGEPVGLATRIPSHEKGNTWWNLPHPFKKGNHLFLLNKARKKIFEENKVYVVEGYMDAITAYQKGLHNVVALMGTALTQRKIGLLIRYCNNVCMSLDIDENESGQWASMKSIHILNEFGVCDNISTMRIPLGEDPASFLLKFSLEDFLSTEAPVTPKDILYIKKKLKQGKK